jgi:alkanesulfonate monooxygenase SsuD/methylene tetrahydromethanopterin reductase-like flavin-dependent oxidoreductase (luciferase family)
MSPSTRIEKLDEGLEIMKIMWTQEKGTYFGKHYSIKEAICLPKPVQKPHPPIWIGGRGGPKIMSIIAKHANGWNISGISTIKDYREKLATLKKICEKIGRDYKVIKTSMAVRGTIHECQTKLGNLLNEDLDLAILRPQRGREIEYIRKLSKFA